MPIDLVVAGAAAKTVTGGVMTPGSPGGGGTFTVGNDAGYPVSGKFAVVIGRGLAEEEKILINSRSGTTFTVGQRGYDGTSAADHPTGVSCELSLPAVTVQALINHENGVDPNPHSGILLNNTAHDVQARHFYGSPGAYGPGTALPTVIQPDAAAAAGVGTTPARADHTHGIVAATATTITGSNAEGASTSFARADHNHALGTDVIGSAQIADTAIDNENYFGALLHPVVEQNTDPGSIGAGRLWFNTASAKKALLRRNAANTAWEVLEAYDWIGYTPTYPGITLGNAVHFARYIRKGGVAIVNGFFRIGSTTSFAGLTNLSITLPTNAQAKDLDSFVGYPGTSTAEFHSHGAARAHDDSAGQQWAAVGLVAHAGAAKALDRIQLFATGGTTAWSQTIPISWVANDRFTYFIEYEVATLEDTGWV